MKLAPLCNSLHTHLLKKVTTLSLSQPCRHLTLAISKVSTPSSELIFAASSSPSSTSNLSLNHLIWVSGLMFPICRGGHTGGEGAEGHTILIRLSRTQGEAISDCNTEIQGFFHQFSELRCAVCSEQCGLLTLHFKCTLHSGVTSKPRYSTKWGPKSGRYHSSHQRFPES